MPSTTGNFAGSVVGYTIDNTIFNNAGNYI